MTEQAAPAVAQAPAPGPIAAAVIANQPISRATAVAALKETRARDGEGGVRPDPARTDAPKGNPYSDVGRKLNEAKKAKAALQSDDLASRTAQESAPADASTVEDEPEGTLDDLTTANGEPPTETDTGDQEEPASGQTIDLGEGVKVTLDEVREGFMLKADHTRKTQALSQERTQFDAKRTQTLSDLENTINLARQTLPQPKSIEELVDELGAEGGLKAFSRQQKAFGGLMESMQKLEQERSRARVDAEASRDQDLAENYNKDWADPTKREKAYSDLTAYLKKEGATPQDMQSLPPTPWLLKITDKAAKYDAIQASKGNVIRTVAEKPKVTRPGARVSQQSAQQRGTVAAYEKLKSSGNLADAVSLLRTLRKKPGAG